MFRKQLWNVFGTDTVVAIGDAVISFVKNEYLIRCWSWLKTHFTISSRQQLNRAPWLTWFVFWLLLSAFVNCLVKYLHHDSTLSLQALWCTTALLTLFKGHVLWDVWCSLVLIVFSAPAIPSGQNPSHEWDDCGAIPGFSRGRILFSEYIVHGGEAGMSHSTEVGQGSISLEAGELPVAQKAPLEQGTSQAQFVHSLQEN